MDGLAIAVGTELRNVAAVSSRGKCYMTQYLGDITSLEALDFESEAIGKMHDLNITCNLDVIACDLHPGYMTSQIAQVISQETGSSLRKTQHRHAHIVSMVVEHFTTR